MLNISTSWYNVLQNLFNYDNIINIYYIKKKANDILINFIHTIIRVCSSLFKLAVKHNISKIKHL